MSDIGQATSATTATFVTALVFNAIVFGIEIALFTLLRPHFTAIYEPRTYIPPPAKRIQPLTPRLSKSLSSFSSTLLWPVALLKADYRNIIKANGMDAYFFVRFLRLMVKILLPIWIVSWLVLLPITSVGMASRADQAATTGTTGEKAGAGLARFIFGNVDTAHQDRYWAHLVCVWAFTLWILYNTKKEMSHFITTRQQHLIDKSHATTVQAHTILVTGVPKRYLTQDALRDLFNDLPGGVRKIWINRNLKELPDIYDRRLAACAKLESAETALLRTAAKLRLKALKASDTTPSKTDAPKAAPDASASSLVASADPHTQSQTGTDAVPLAQRPQHRTGPLGLWGPKVDTIEWCRAEIVTCTALLDEGRARIARADQRTNALAGAVSLKGAAVDEDGNPVTRARKSGGEEGEGLVDVKAAMREAVGGVKDAGGKVVGGVKDVSGKVVGGVKSVLGKGGDGDDEDKYEPLNSAFVTFEKQIAAHLAVQVLAHHAPYRMSARYVEVAPSDVIWANLGLNPYEQKVRLAISYAATLALILLWAIPVAFVGVVSNIYTVCARAVFLRWVCTLPKVVVGIISGILPPVLLAVLMMLLPIVLRLLARFEGIPKYTGLELSLMTRFFMFQVLHSFLIVTLSSGVVASLQELLDNPTSIPTVLAQNLPKASTFFLTYIVLQGLSGAAGGFLQIVTLIVYYVKLFLLGSTPRSIYGIKYTPGSVAWGTLFPSITLLAVITLGYSIIAPIINGLALLTFFLFYQLYKYLFLWVYKQNMRSDTGGLFFPKAIQHIFVGLYVEEICLTALFFLARDAGGRASSVPHGALMIVLIVITAGFHAILNHSYGPLIVALPLSLKNRLGQSVSGLDEERVGDDDESGKAMGGVEAEEEDVDRKTSKSRTPHDLEGGFASEDAALTRQGLLVAEETRSPPAPNADANPSRSPSPESKTERKIGSASATEEQAELERYGYAHPAASRPQRTVWIPRDALGLSAGEVEGCEGEGVDVSVEGAEMDASGAVEIGGAPPGYDGM